MRNVYGSVRLLLTKTLPKNLDLVKKLEEESSMDTINVFGAYF
jgi:hypothetical protein